VAAWVIQHLDEEGPLEIGRALEREGIELRSGIPDTMDDVEALVVMGGPQSAYSDRRFPTRQRELLLLEEAILLGVPTLGICLGAQLLAVAAGGRCRRGTAGPEVGWFPVEVTQVNDPLFGGLRRFTTLHWHGDTFDLPPEAVHLASSERYPNQAFRVGERAWGIQFHPEVDQAAVDLMVKTFDGDPAIAEQAGQHLRHPVPIVARFAEVVAP
jgi:GMP synthase-like glutamine amidotransferase